MKTKEIFKIFYLSTRLSYAECLSLQGHRYSSSLPFQLVFVQDADDANVIILDEIYSHSAKHSLEQLLSSGHVGKRAVIQLCDLTSLLEGELGYSPINFAEIPLYKLAWGNASPEAFLQILIECFENLYHVDN